MKYIKIKTKHELIQKTSMILFVKTEATYARTSHNRGAGILIIIFNVNSGLPYRDPLSRSDQMEE